MGALESGVFFITMLKLHLHLRIHIIISIFSRQRLKNTLYMINIVHDNVWTKTQCLQNHEILAQHRDAKTPPTIHTKNRPLE